jgi:hypothetical protein
VKQVYCKLVLTPSDAREADPMDAGNAVVLFEGNTGPNKRENRPEPPPHVEKASPYPKKKKVSPSDESASAIVQPRREQ